MGKILIYYKYCTIENPGQLVSWQKQLCKQLGLNGRIIIAHEGINGTVGGEDAAIHEYKEIMHQQQLFHDIDFKEASGDASHFPRLRVVLRNEIVALGLDPKKITAQNAGKHLSPRQTHELLSNKPADLVILDARNAVESAIGTFSDAIRPEIAHFRDLPNYIDNNVEQFKNKKVLMYCTAGVRCERASAYLKSKGVAQEVYQLTGGIHRYIEQFPKGFFKGKNYVFDGRISVKVTEDILGRCAVCSTPCDEYNNCLNAVCNKHFICCDVCIINFNYTCSQHCYDLVTSGKTPVRPLFKRSALNQSLPRK